jgi:hypothetical protein
MSPDCCAPTTRRFWSSRLPERLLGLLDEIDAAWK